MVLYPLCFQPIFKERVWGGRRLQELYDKQLPLGVPIGESWEVSDRPEDVSVVANGPLAGKDLHWLVQNHPLELFGSASSAPNRFPLLIKLLDARDRLSLQVHPPAEKAPALGGDPKTEMWYIADADPGAELYVGLKRSVTKGSFAQNIKEGTVEACFHRLPVRTGDAMFLPSGRVHAIGAGLVIFEIQENSDTTYRVFDWNRLGLDGKARELHVAQSLDSIDFTDFEPELISHRSRIEGVYSNRPLVRHDLFKVDLVTATQDGSLVDLPRRLRIIGVVKGSVTISGSATPIELSPGRFCLIPASINAEILAREGAMLLQIELGT